MPQPCKTQQRNSGCKWGMVWYLDSDRNAKLAGQSTYYTQIIPSSHTGCVMTHQSMLNLVVCSMVVPIEEPLGPA